MLGTIEGYEFTDESTRNIEALKRGLSIYR
jgi:hypothetical protein